MLRRPMTIWRHTTAELWKLLLLTTAVLVGVISFAITIKPLADGQLSAFDAIRFMLLASVPMLAYALPFAAGFAATLVFHRMAQDNELSASHAGGVSHRTLLTPALISGLVLAVVVGLLSDQVIPRFLRTMEKMITEDVARLMVNRLGAGETVEFGGNLIYADTVQRIDPSTMKNASGAEDVISLYRASFGRLGPDKKLEAGGTAERAFIVIYREGEEERGAGSIVRLVASNYNSWGNTFIAESPAQLVYDFAVPGAFRDDPKFWSFVELGEIAKNPKLMVKIANHHHRLALRAASLEMLAEVDRQLRTEGRATLTTTQGETITIIGRGMGTVSWLSRGLWPTKPGGEVVIERQRPGGAVTQTSAKRAFIDTLQLDELAATRVLGRIVLEEVTTTGNDEAAGRRREQQITGILAPSDQTASLEALTYDELLERTGVGKEDTPPAIAEVHKQSIRSETGLQHEIVSKSHMRIAMSAACLVMVLVGATVAMKLRDALPLTVYLWAFFPALGAVLTISTAEQLAQDSGWPGLVLMWGAVVGLLGYAIATYKRVAVR